MRMPVSEFRILNALLRTCGHIPIFYKEVRIRKIYSPVAPVKTGAEIEPVAIVCRQNIVYVFIRNSLLIEDIACPEIEP